MKIATPQKYVLKLLRRSFFKGQHRIFNYLFKKGALKNSSSVIAKPLTGDFEIACNTNTWIGAQIVFLGEYEDYIKQCFAKHVHKNATVLDIGANIGFHTLYFAELVGEHGQVYAFEPMPHNFKQLQNNINRNKKTNIYPKQMALGAKKEILNVQIDLNSSNPGASHLFDKGDTAIECHKGDEMLAGQKVDFIKIDVEGFELQVLQGLKETITLHQPTIVFEYDSNYQQKSNTNPTEIFSFLASLKYSFQEIKRNKTTPINNWKTLKAADILALPVKA